MTDMQRYVVEEWAEEYRQGRLARREFLRRMTLMCGGVALAAPVCPHRTCWLPFFRS